MKFTASICLGLFAVLLSPVAAKASVVTFDFTSTVVSATQVGTECTLGGDCTFIEPGTTALGSLSFDTESNRLLSCSTGLAYGAGCPRGDSLLFRGEYSSESQTLTVSQVTDGTNYVYNFDIGPDGGSYSSIFEFGTGGSRYAELTFSDVTVSEVPIGSAGMLLASGLGALAGLRGLKRRARKKPS